MYYQDYYKKIDDILETPELKLGKNGKRKYILLKKLYELGDELDLKVYEP